MIIEGYVELKEFHGLYKYVTAKDVDDMKHIVDTWFENKRYQEEILDAVVSPENALYTCGTWEDMSDATLTKAQDNYLKFRVEFSFETEQDEDSFYSDMQDIGWGEEIEIPVEDPYAPFEYITFDVQYDTIVEDK